MSRKKTTVGAQLSPDVRVVRQFIIHAQPENLPQTCLCGRTLSRNLISITRIHQIKSRGPTARNILVAHKKRITVRAISEHSLPRFHKHVRTCLHAIFANTTVARIYATVGMSCFLFFLYVHVCYATQR